MAQTKNSAHEDSSTANHGFEALCDPKGVQFNSNPTESRRLIEALPNHALPA